MRTTLNIDDELLGEAQRLTGVAGKARHWSAKDCGF